MKVSSELFSSSAFIAFGVPPILSVATGIYTQLIDHKRELQKTILTCKNSFDKEKLGIKTELPKLRENYSIRSEDGRIVSSWEDNGLE